jgi:hypothetical protein
MNKALLLLIRWKTPMSLVAAPGVRSFARGLGAGGSLNIQTIPGGFLDGHGRDSLREAV